MEHPVSLKRLCALVLATSMTVTCIAAEVSPAVREYRLHMFDPPISTLANRSIELMFDTRTVAAGRQPRKLPVALRSLSENPSTFAESVMTTDRTQKVFAKEVFFAGTLVQIHAVAKGSGMIAPALATTLCFITTDAAISVKALRRSLSEVVAGTLNQLTVDGDMSTNDAVVMMANGAADNELIEEGTPNHEWFTDALRELLVEVARSIAKDGEGATRMIEVSVEGAKTLEDARQLAVSVADSSLVKAAVFGADPYAWGRILASLGARAGRIGADFDPATLSLTLQGVKVFDAGKPVKDGLGPLKFRMAEREIAVHARLGRGGASAKAWGCDLTYDYVKINADYARATTTSAEAAGARRRQHHRASAREARRADLSRPRPGGQGHGHGDSRSDGLG